MAAKLNTNTVKAVLRRAGFKEAKKIGFYGRSWTRYGEGFQVHKIHGENTIIVRGDGNDIREIKKVLVEAGYTVVRTDDKYSVEITVR